MAEEKNYFDGNREYRSDFLSKNRRKVEKVMNLDFTFERQLELTRKEERELGREETVLSLLKKGKISLSDASEELGIDEEKVSAMLEEML